MNPCRILYIYIYAQKRSLQPFEILSSETFIFRKMYSKIFYSDGFDFSTTNDSLGEGGKIKYYRK